MSRLVLIDATVHTRSRTGTAVVLDALLADLPLALGEGWRVEPVARKRPTRGRRARNLASDLLWLHRELPRIAEREGAAVLVHPTPEAAAMVPCPQVTVVHDLLFLDRPADYDPGWRTYATNALRLAIARADRLACVSRTTAEEVARRFPVARDRVRVTPNGLRRLPRPEAPAPVPTPYVLCPGEHEPRKRVPLLIEAVDALRRDSGADVSLVLCGGGGHDAHRVAELAGDRPYVHDLGFVPATTLAALFAEALAVALPSAGEGFGLPALEAMAAGAPVVCAPVVGLTEVCGPAAFYTAPTSGGFAEAIGALVRNPALRDRHVQLGRIRARRYSRAAAAEAMAAVVREVAA